MSCMVIIPSQGQSFDQGSGYRDPTQKFPSQGIFNRWICSTLQVFNRWIVAYYKYLTDEFVAHYKYLT